jgi:hypothetical protein
MLQSLPDASLLGLSVSQLQALTNMEATTAAQAVAWASDRLHDLDSLPVEAAVNAVEASHTPVFCHKPTAEPPSVLSDCISEDAKKPCEALTTMETLTLQQKSSTSAPSCSLPDRTKDAHVSMVAGCGVSGTAFPKFDPLAHHTDVGNTLVPGLAELPRNQCLGSHKTPPEACSSFTVDALKHPLLSKKNVRQLDNSVLEVAQQRSKSCSGATQRLSPLSQSQPGAVQNVLTCSRPMDLVAQIQRLPPLSQMQSGTIQEPSTLEGPMDIVAQAQSSSAGGSAGQVLQLSKRGGRACRGRSDGVLHVHLNGNSASSSMTNGSAGKVSPLDITPESSAKSSESGESANCLKSFENPGRTIAVETRHRTLSPLCTVAGSATTIKTDEHTHAVTRPGTARGMCQGGAPMKLASMPNTAALAQSNVTSCDGNASTVSKPGSARSQSTDRGILKLAPLSNPSTASLVERAPLLLEHAPFTVPVQAMPRPGSAPSKPHCGAAVKLAPLSSAAATAQGDAAAHGSETHGVPWPGSSRSKSCGEATANLAPLPNAAARANGDVAAHGRKAVREPGSARGTSQSTGTLKLSPLLGTATRWTSESLAKQAPRVLEASCKPSAGAATKLSPLSNTAAMSPLKHPGLQAGDNAPLPITVYTDKHGTSGSAMHAANVPCDPFASSPAPWSHQNEGNAAKILAEATKGCTRYHGLLPLQCGQFLDALPQNAMETGQAVPGCRQQLVSLPFFSMHSQEVSKNVLSRPACDWMDAALGVFSFDTCRLGVVRKNILTLCSCC